MPVLPVKQLTTKECYLIDRVVRKQKGTAKEAFQKINAERRKQRPKVKPITYPAVTKYVNGKTHVRGAAETRGAKKKLSSNDVKHLLATRRKLIQEADNQQRVTYEDIVEAADLDGSPGLRTCQDAMREAGVSFKPPRKKIQISEDDAANRLKVLGRLLDRCRLL